MIAFTRRRVFGLSKLPHASCTPGECDEQIAQLAVGSVSWPRCKCPRQWLFESEWAVAVDDMPVTALVIDGRRTSCCGKFPTRSIANKSKSSLLDITSKSWSTCWRDRLPKSREFSRVSRAASAKCDWTNR